MATTSVTIPGDIMDSILFRLPAVDLVAASSVSTTWQRAVYSTLLWSPRRRHPWLILCHHRHCPPSSTTHAFDAHTRSWHSIPLTPPSPPPTYSALPRSSTSTSLLFYLTPSRLSFSSDPFHRTWFQSTSTPSVWRRDPVVASVGPYLVVAGGVCEFEDDPLAVEVLDVRTGRWKTCESMPEEFQCSASAMWLSTAVADEKVHIVDKSTGLFSSFDPVSGNWGEVVHILPNSSFSLFSIAGAGRELVAAGLSPGQEAGVPNLSLLKLNAGTLDGTEIGTMPSEMTAKLAKNGNGTTISALEVRTAGTPEAAEFAYVYNSWDTSEIFFCEMKPGGCEWGSAPIPVAGHRVPMDCLLFTCSPVELDELREALAPAVAGN